MKTTDNEKMTAALKRIGSRRYLLEGEARQWEDAEALLALPDVELERELHHRAAALAERLGEERNEAQAKLIRRTATDPSLLTRLKATGLLDTEAMRVVFREDKKLGGKLTDPIPAKWRKEWVNFKGRCRTALGRKTKKKITTL